MLNRLGVVMNAARRLLLNAGAASSWMEGLEVREVMAAVSWDGGAGTANWHDALNWSNDAIPVAADDVTIPSTALSEIAFTATTGSRTIRSLSSQEAINFSGGTLTV